MPGRPLLRHALLPQGRALPGRHVRACLGVSEVSWSRWITGSSRRPRAGLLAIAALLLGLAVAAPSAGGGGAGPRASCGELQRSLERLQQELAALQRRAEGP